MFGANAPIDKTNWLPLNGKHITIWPDKDNPDHQYSINVAKKLLDLGVTSVSNLKIPQDKPKGWDAADCTQEGTYIEQFLAPTIRIPYRKKRYIFSCRSIPK